MRAYATEAGRSCELGIQLYKKHGKQKHGKQLYSYSCSVATWTERLPGVLVWTRAGLVSATLTNLYTSAASLQTTSLSPRRTFMTEFRPEQAVSFDITCLCRPMCSSVKHHILGPSNLNCLRMRVAGITTEHISHMQMKRTSAVYMYPWVRANMVQSTSYNSMY